MHFDEINSYRFAVLPIGPFDKSFSYMSTEKINVGEVVSIPFGKKNIIGVVVDEPVCMDKELKFIHLKFNFSIPSVSIKFIDWVARYTVSNRGKILKMVLGETSLFRDKKLLPSDEDFIYDLKEIILSNEQKETYNYILDKLPNGKPIVLHGVTGSGKTEVYLKILQHLSSKNGQFLILFPEIALTQQMLDRIGKYFGITPFIWTSEQSKKERKRILRFLQTGKPCIVIGSRSALFLPYKNLTAIVVDEEHDTSYKQEEQVIYNARDMAVVRAKLGQIPIILSSATPSLETYVNTKIGKYEYVKMANRFGPAILPYVETLDLKKSRDKQLISEALHAQIAKNLENNEQVLLYINRRGYAPITVCKKCGTKIECPNCSALLIHYKENSRFVCNHCGYWSNLPKNCRECGSEGSFMLFGAGVEKVYEEAQKRYPNAKISIASSDTMHNFEASREIINDISEGKTDIIIATQILAKGHHFRHLTLVGVIDGDFGLDMADIRAHEKTFQLLNQVAGRAGREEKLGRIYIQTFEPNKPFFDMVKNNATTAFLEHEMNSRKEYGHPPFCKMIAIIISGNNADMVENAAKNLAKIKINNVNLLGPIPAQMFKLRGKTRWRILLRSAKNVDIQGSTTEWLAKFKCPAGVNIQIDVDPINFL